MLNLYEVTDIKPVCPHCGIEISTVLSRRLKSTFGVKYIYFCEHCKKVLGVSHRKGFWMG